MKNQVGSAAVWKEKRAKILHLQKNKIKNSHRRGAFERQYTKSLFEEVHTSFLNFFFFFFLTVTAT